MKKASVLMMAAAVATGLASCTAQTPKANLKTNVDTLTYAVGMAQTQGIRDFLMSNGVDSAQMNAFISGLNEGAKAVSKKDIARIMGLSIGQQVQRMAKGINMELYGTDSVMSINKDNLLAGFVAGTLGKGGMMTMQEAEIYMRSMMQPIKDKIAEEQYASNKEAGEKFLAENKNKANVKTTASGLQYEILKEGNGPVPADTCKVKVNYKGTLIDGTEFDSSKEPATFRANQVIKGWTEALTMMPVGSKWKLYIPQELAYGAQERGQYIKPFSALVFEVELLSIEK